MEQPQANNTTGILQRLHPDDRAEQKQILDTIYNAYCTLGFRWHLQHSWIRFLGHPPRRIEDFQKFYRRARNHLDFLTDEQKEALSAVNMIAMRDSYDGDFVRPSIILFGVSAIIETLMATEYIAPLFQAIPIALMLLSSYIMLYSFYGRSNKELTIQLAAFPNEKPQQPPAESLLIMEDWEDKIAVIENCFTDWSFKREIL